jgi:hypothetical protein
MIYNIYCDNPNPNEADKLFKDEMAASKFNLKKSCDKSMHYKARTKARD